MNIQYVRSSSINTYHDCELKYFLEYIVQLPSLAGKKALLGTICHHVLEIMARAKKTDHYILDDRYIDPDYLLDICWNRYTEEEKERFEFAKADFNFCKRTIKKVLDSSFNPLNLDIVATEKQFRIPLSDPGFSFEVKDLLSGETIKSQYEIRGTVDLVTKISEDTLEVIDWKTGKNRCWTTGVTKDFAYMATKDIQMRMYDLALSMLYPEYPHIMLTMHFINDGGPITVSFSDEAREETKRMLKEFFGEVQDNPLPSRLKERNPKDASWKCKKVCHFGRTKNADGVPVCDRVYSYMLDKGVDETIIKIEELKRQKQDSTKEGKTSNRRNEY